MSVRSLFLAAVVLSAPGCGAIIQYPDQPMLSQTSSGEPQAALIAALRAPDLEAVEMPWLWQMLKREFRSRLPRHRDVIVCPVIVDSPNDDSVPGVGFEGEF